MHTSGTVCYSPLEVSPYINWTYFFHAWGFEPRFAGIAQLHGCDACRASWLASFPADTRAKASEAMQLYKEAGRMLRQLDADYTVHALYRLCRANSEGDDLLLDGVRLPLLRQQRPTPGSSHCLCLSDFVRPASTGVSDTVGVFAASADAELEQLYSGDPYRHLLVQTLADRLAEAAAEKLHAYVRTTAWGYAPDEQLSMADLHAEKFQGIRPAVGYPSLPDQSVIFVLDRLLDLSRIGIRLTENGAMQPHASTCGLMLSHPAARYFPVGRIGEDQLADYARRSGKSVDQLRRFLAANLS